MKCYEDFAKALVVLAKAPDQDLCNEFVRDGIINKFKLQLVLACKLMCVLLAHEGDAVGNSESPREIVKAACQYYDCMDEESWLRMLRDYGNALQICEDGAAEHLVTSVLDSYIPEFERFKQGLIERYGEDFLLG